jgi:hypothetical protein
VSDDKCEILFENEMAKVMEEIFADEDVAQEYAVSFSTATREHDNTETMIRTT